MGSAEVCRPVGDIPVHESAGPATDLLHAMLTASEGLDPGGIRDVLDRAEDALGMAECIDEVVLPAMRQIGAWWAVGRCEAAQERMATEAVRAWLDWRTAFAPNPLAYPPIVLTCGPRDLHTVGLECLALLLRFQRWPCRNLGARVPTGNLIIAAQASAPAAVVVVSHLSSSRRHAVASIEALDQLGLPVYFAGNAFGTAASRSGLPGGYLGTNLQIAARQLVRGFNS